MRRFTDSVTHSMHSKLASNCRRKLGRSSRKLIISKSIDTTSGLVNPLPMIFSSSAVSLNAGTLTRSSSKPLYIDVSAVAPSGTAIKQLVLISMMAMLIFASARARNIRPAAPAVAGMPALAAVTPAMAGPSSSSNP